MRLAVLHAGRVAPPSREALHTLARPDACAPSGAPSERRSRGARAAPERRLDGSWPLTDFAPSGMKTRVLAYPSQSYSFRAARRSFSASPEQRVGPGSRRRCGTGEGAVYVRRGCAGCVVGSSACESCPAACADSPSAWRDAAGRSCADYERGDLCSLVGVVGVGWTGSLGASIPDLQAEAQSCETRSDAGPVA